MNRTIALIMGLVVGCLAAATASAALDEERLMTVSGIERSYCVYRPDSYQDGAPAVFFFHGTYGNCHGEMADAWRDKADAEGFLLVAPNALYNGWNACSIPPQRCRNPFGFSEVFNVNDIGYFDQLAATISAEFLPGAIYVSGISKGGMFAYHLLCNRPDEINAGAAVAATNVSQTCTDSAVPLLHLHGTDDMHVPWDGGTVLAWPPVAPAIDAQAAHNGCSDSVVVLDETADAISYRYQDCDSETVYWRYVCQHGWPGLTTQWWWQVLGLRCTDSFHAEDVIWSFLQGQ